MHDVLKNKKVVLASASPRRVELLKQLGLQFIQLPADIDETMHPADNVNPKRYVQRIATLKCNAVKQKLDEDCLIIAADTTVYLNKSILGKPTCSREAFEFLKQLSGQTHLVYTGLAISFGYSLECDVAKSYVTFAELTDAEIMAYINTKEPMDKAGAYGIQGYGSQFIEKINGCYFNVMGFPIRLFYEIVKRIVV